MAKICQNYGYQKRPGLSLPSASICLGPKSDGVGADLYLDTRFKFSYSGALILTGYCGRMFRGLRRA